MKSIVWMIQENSRMSNQCAVDNYPSFPVNLRYFLYLLILKDCWAVPEIGSLILGIRMVYRETFLQVHLHTLRHLVLEHSAHGMTDPATERIPEKASTGEPEVGMSDRDRDAIPTPRCLRSPSAGKACNPMERRIFFRIMGLTSNDFKSRNFTLTSSLLHKRFRVGR